MACCWFELIWPTTLADPRVKDLCQNLVVPRFGNRIIVDKLDSAAQLGHGSCGLCFWNVGDRGGRHFVDCSTDETEYANDYCAKYVFGIAGEGRLSIFNQFESQDHDNWGSQIYVDGWTQSHGTGSICGQTPRIPWFLRIPLPNRLSKNGRFIPGRICDLMRPGFRKCDGQ